jgi:hypothetical protein
MKLRTYAFTVGRVKGPWFENFSPEPSKDDLAPSYRRCWVARIPGVIALCFTLWDFS